MDIMEIIITIMEVIITIMKVVKESIREARNFASPENQEK